MLDNYNRNISYLRISVTDRCNLRCSYCMPEEGIDLMAHEDLLSFEEIVNFIEEAVKTGITKVRLTGGEPLVRKGIVELVEKISSIKGLEDLALTTNGVLLEKYADDLAKAGLKRVNISLDTLNPKTYREITRCGNIEDVFKGIEASKKAGLSPIKINCVRMPDSSETELIALKAYCKSNDLDLRFIRQMNLETGDFSIVEGGEGGNCKKCNRIRLTANGKVKPCLFNQNEFDVKKLGAKDAIKRTIESKPEEGSKNKIGKFYNIGG